MARQKKCTFKLEADEYIVTAYARAASGPGWVNYPLWVVVASNATGKMREACLQPHEQTEEMRMLYAFSALATAKMTAAVERIASKPNDKLSDRHE